MFTLIRNLPVKHSLKNLRCLGTTSNLNGTFKVQDDKDFCEKVENSKEPVIVDFFAK